ncbi:hypothetical protein ATANTOWER_010981 [Ataeniobius toweri]|uniref:Uncharacterized protein n=1 Tax=Ataeniobius toweri TaxID=208326 RepID=A0ABU7BRY5_9TELE|nr:hypothetical protein [Ataeniobius toweri]
MDEPPPHPDPIPDPALEGSDDELPPSLVPVPEEFMEDLSTLPVSVPEGCEDTPSTPAVPRRLRRRSPRPCQRPRQFLPLRRRPADRRICWGRPPVRPPKLWVCRGQPPGRPPELWVCPGRSPGRPPEVLP